jgi:hypothetical protein
VLVVESVVPAGVAMEMVGSTPSPRVTVMTSVPAWPAASFAVTVITLTPDSSGTLAIDHVPAAMPPAPAPPLSLVHVTCVTPNASEAEPLIARLSLPVE